MRTMHIDDDLARELQVAHEAAAEAAAILVGRSGADQVRAKGRADLVTAVDEAAERVIERHLRSAFPDDGFVAEEFSSDARPSGRRWVVDPLDGTVNFVHRHPFACVSIALVDDDGPRIGVINAPFLGEVYHAVRGGGAFLNEERIRVSSVPEAGEALLATGFPFRKGKGDASAYFRLVADVVLSTHGVRRAGAAAIDLAYVACGRVDGFFEIGLSPWDVAAGILLVLEAGGVVSGWPGDTEPPLETGRILATNGAVHRWLEETVARHVPRL
ncbi:MAG: inositol monophosphatase family protein [Gemmatimonadota bacterium]